MGRPVNLRTGLLRLYLSVWGLGATAALIATVFVTWNEVSRRDDFSPVYILIWVGLALIVPAVVLKLLIWVVDGFVDSAE